MTAPACADKPPSPPKFSWSTVVNNNDVIPEVVPERKFNSYNPPSVSANGVVVFRARSRGGMGMGPATHGIYTRDMVAAGEIVKILDRTTLVPEPNNLGITFTETPAFPRIDRDWDTIVTRGNHQPVLEYTPEGETESTRGGTSGIYAKPYGELITGAAKLGIAPGYEFFAVPGIDPPIPFEVFPGAPAVTDQAFLVFKGNYTLEGAENTGAFYRDLSDEDSVIEMIASTSATVIPGTSELFGSVSPPSAATVGNRHWAVFSGFDNEWQPTLGGIYLAPILPHPLSGQPSLTPLVTIGSRVPDGSARDTFTHLGEGSSFDGNYVGFWGSWGSETRSVRLYCPEEGDQDRRDYCNNTGDFADGTGDPDSICDDATDDTDRCYQEMEVPVDQGIFVHDVRKGRTVAVAKTGAEFDDFLFWNYSGRVPGVSGGHGEEGDDGEPVRWRSSAYVAVSEGTGKSFMTAFKGAKGEVEGIYLSPGPGKAVLTVVDTTLDGQVLDPEAPADTPVSEVGLEREGFRKGWLVINARIGVEEDEGMAGVYQTKVPPKP